MVLSTSGLSVRLWHDYWKEGLSDNMPLFPKISIEPSDLVEIVRTTSGDEMIKRILKMKNANIDQWVHCGIEWYVMKVRRVDCDRACEVLGIGSNMAIIEISVVKK